MGLAIAMIASQADLGMCGEPAQTPLAASYGGSNTYGHSARAMSPIWRYHPRPIYAHSLRGIHSERVQQWNNDQAATSPWHGQYYHLQWGQPLALLVPPTAAFQTNYGWGAGQTTSLPINHQFARPYPGPASGGGGQHYLRTPNWRSNTNQSGVYPVRGPW